MSLLNGNNRAVPDVPFYMSAALTEFTGTATGNISAAMTAAEVAVPGLVSQLGGLSASTTTHTMTVGRYNNTYEDADDHYGYNDGTVSPGVPFGTLTPLTLDIEGSTVTIHSIDGMFYDDAAETFAQIYTSTFSFIPQDPYEMVIAFPNGETFKFTLYSHGSIAEWRCITNTFALLLQDYNSQTINLSITAGIVEPTHVITGEVATGTTDAGDEYWKLIGYSDGSYTPDIYDAPYPYGDLTPVTFTVGSTELTFVNLAGSFDGGESGDYFVSERSVLRSTYDSFSTMHRMDITFPSGKTHGFLAEDSYHGTWAEIDYTISPTFAETMDAYYGEPTGMTIVVSPITLKEAGDTGVYVNYLTPEGVTDALYFIDPLQFDTTGEVKAFTDIAKRDATVPLFTQQVPKPPANYYPGTHAYVDGEWVPK